MHTTQSLNVFARNPAAVARPVLAKLELLSVETVLGWSDRQTAEWLIARDLNNLAAAEKNSAAACAQLGQANRSRVMRRRRVADAFRLINQRRGQLRAARKALAASRTAMSAFAGASA